MPDATFERPDLNKFCRLDELGLVACQPRPWRPTTTKQGPAGPIPDLVNRDFTAGVPGQKMVGDITYIETWEGWAFLATVIDCATRGDYIGVLVGIAQQQLIELALGFANGTAGVRGPAAGTGTH